MPPGFQRQVYRVKAQLDLFNQAAELLRRQTEMTFDSSLSDVNRKIIEQELERGYQKLGEDAEGIANLITDVVCQDWPARGRARN